MADGFLCRIVGPDQIPGSVIIEEPFLRGGIQVCAKLHVGAVAVSQPGHMVPIDHHDNAPLFPLQFVQEYPQLLGRILDRGKVIIHNEGGLCGVPAIREAFSLPLVLRSSVGTVTLIGDIKGEIGVFSPVVPIQLQNLREQQPVRRQIHTIYLVIVIFEIVIGGQAQIAVDIPAVIEPLVAGVTSLYGVALALQVPGVGVGIGPEISQVRIACKEGPLRIHGAAGKNVGDEIACHTLCLDGVEGRIGLLKINALHILKPGEIRKGLQLNGDQIHLFLLRDVRIGVTGQHRGSFRLVIALRLLCRTGGDRVKEGIDKSLGDIELGSGPAVDMVIVRGKGIVHPLRGISLACRETGKEDHRSAGKAAFFPRNTPGGEIQHQRTEDQAYYSEYNAFIRG